MMQTMNVIESFINTLENSRGVGLPLPRQHPPQLTEAKDHGLYKTIYPLKYREVFLPTSHTA